MFHVYYLIIIKGMLEAVVFLGVHLFNGGIYFLAHLFAKLTVLFRSVVPDYIALFGCEKTPFPVIS